MKVRNNNNYRRMQYIYFFKQHVFTLEKNYFIQYSLLNYITNFQSACRECWVLHCTAALCEYAGVRYSIGQMTHKIHTRNNSADSVPISPEVCRMIKYIVGYLGI